MTREQAVQIIENMPISHECREFFRLALEALRQPEIIRCKDCKRRGTYDCPVHIGCSGGGYDEPDDWFCGDGERRTNDA